MTSSTSGLRDATFCALDMARELGRDRFGLIGYGTAELLDGDGRTLLLVPFANLITDNGDLWYASKATTSTPPSNNAEPTDLTGMQIGSGSTAVTKAGAGSAMVTLLAGQAFDATFPSTNNLGAGLGVEGVYKTTYAAGTGTGTVNEATITNGTIGTASTAGNTISRVLTGAITKGASDSLAITWRHKFLGA